MIPIILTTISMIRAIVPIMAVFISIMIYMQVVIDLDLMYSGDGSLAFSLQSMRCEIKKAKISFLMALLDEKRPFYVVCLLIICC